jgi:hypothetical protein
MMYALRPDLSFISPRTLVHGMAIIASKIAHTKHLTNYCPAIKTLPAAGFIFNPKANIANRNKRYIQHTEKRILLPPGTRLWGYCS